MARAESPEATVKRNAAQALCAAHDPACDWLGTLSSLERESVVRVLAARGYVLDPQPWGKVIGNVDVFNEDVFAEPTPILEFFNIFHYTTRESAIRDELTTHAGELWSQDLVDESARRLRDPLWSSVVVALPVTSRAAGKVDLLVVTRDVWSLRLNTKYTYQEGSLTNLSISLSENNFLGNRDVVAAALTMDQGAIAVGPLFIDKNLAGTHLNLQARVDDILTRKDLLDDGHIHSEGSDSTISLSKPLWRLASEWGWGAQFTHRFAISRQFIGTNLRTYDDPDTFGDDMIPWKYSTKTWDLQANGVRQWGTDLKHQFGFGYELDSLKVRPPDDFVGDDFQRMGFIRDVLPRSEFTSAPFINYTLFTPWYKTLRNVNTYDLAEDVQMGLSFDVGLVVGLHALGGDFNFARTSSSLAWTFPFGKDGYIRPSTSISMRFRGDTPVTRHDDVTFIDNTGSGSIRIVSPTIGYGRIVAQTTLASRWNDTQNAILAIGSDSGLRGFDINEFFGQRVASTLVEARTIPWSLWVLRMGGVLFTDIGGAANSFSEMHLHSDVGIGFRMLTLQTSRELFRFDLAFPLDGVNPLYPHFIASFDSYF